MHDTGCIGARSTEELEAGRRRVTLVEMTKRKQEGPYRSTMKAQDWNLLTHAVQSSTHARLIGRQS